MSKQSKNYDLTPDISYGFRSYNDEDPRVYVIFWQSGSSVSIGFIPLDDFEKSIKEQKDGHSKGGYPLVMSFCSAMLSLITSTGAVEISCTEEAFHGFCKTALAFCKKVRTC